MITKKLPILRINSDDAEYLINPQEYLGGLNVRHDTNENGKFGKSLTIEGTRLIYTTINSVGARVTFTLPAGTNDCHGAIEDPVTRRMFWWNYNSNGDHGLYCYDGNSDIIYTVIGPDNFNLNIVSRKFIHSAVVVGSLLYWTDDENEPRRVNVDSAIALNHPTYVTEERAYASITASTIALIRAQPEYPITGNFVPDPGGVFMDQDSYNAAYRFIYKDREESTFSELSARVYCNPVPGFIDFKIPFTQQIPDDVDSVELAVRYESDGKYQVYKTWTRAANADDFTAHNAGILQLSYAFFENTVGLAISDQAANKPYDYVPRLAGTLDVSKGRLFMGDTLIGYESPSICSLTASIATGVTSNQLLVFKSGSPYRIGKVFYDKYGRFCPVISKATVNTPFKTEDPSSWSARINWSLSNVDAVNEIPEWATSYSIVRTKSKRAAFFTQFKTTEVKFVTKDTDGNFNFVDTIPANGIYGLGLRASELYKYGIGYDYTEGDIAILSNDTAAPVLVRVLEVFSDYIITEFNYFSDDMSTLQLGVEVYTPFANNEQDFFYETGNKYAINNPGTASRSYSTTSGSLTGDVVLKQRFFTTVESYYAEVMNYNDKIWKSWFQGLGRQMIEDDRPVKRGRTILCFSGEFTPGVNGLSSFDALNFEVLPIEMGSIEKVVNTSKVQTEGTVLLAIGKQESASVYIGETQIFDQTGAATLAKSSGVIGTVNILRGSYGTINPESVFEWKGQVMWFDANKGVWVLYTNNGLFPVSSYKMVNYWRQIGEDVLSILSDPTDYNNANPDLPFRLLGAIDPFHEEFLSGSPRMTVIPRNTILTDIELGSQTVAFTTAPDCSLTVVVADVSADCRLEVVAYDLTPTPTPTGTPTSTPTPTITPTVYTICLGYDATLCSAACADHATCIV